jgi:hypothetical protein
MLDFSKFDNNCYSFSGSTSFQRQKRFATCSDGFVASFVIFQMLQRLNTSGPFG